MRTQQLRRIASDLSMSGWLRAGLAASGRSAGRKVAVRCPGHFRRPPCSPIGSFPVVRITAEALRSRRPALARYFRMKAAAVKSLGANHPSMGKSHTGESVTERRDTKKHGDRIAEYSEEQSGARPFPEAIDDGPSHHVGGIARR